MDQETTSCIKLTDGVRLHGKDIYVNMICYTDGYIRFLLQVFTMQAVMVFYPVYIIIKRQRTGGTTLIPLHGFIAREYSMARLEHALERFPTLLLNFANKERSGENIAFLIAVAAWKKSWNVYRSLGHEKLRRYMFNLAVRLFATDINLTTAKYPVNVDFSVYEHLVSVLGSAMRFVDIPEVANPILPFEDIPTSPGVERSSTTERSGTTPPFNTPRTSFDSKEDIPPFDEGSMITIPNDFTIPEDFDSRVFDGAILSTKRLVLRDTWPKYVKYLKSQTESQHAINYVAEPPRKWWNKIWMSERTPLAQGSGSI